MIDLDRAFRDADQAPVSDLWPEIVTRSPKPLPPAPPGRRAATIVIALLIAVAGIGFAIRIFTQDPSVPADPSPTPSGEFSAGPAPRPSGLQVSYDARDLAIRGSDPTSRASGFRIQFYRGYAGGVCVLLWSEDPAEVRAGNPYGVTGVRSCSARIGVGDDLGIGNVVMMFGPSETSSATAFIRGAPREALVLQLPSRFVHHEATELGHQIDLKMLVLIGPVQGGRVITRDAAGQVLGTMPLPVDVGLCGPPTGPILDWCPGPRGG